MCGLVAQALTGHGIFRSFADRIGKAVAILLATMDSGKAVGK